MSTARRKLTKDEIERAFAEGNGPSVPQILNTVKAAEFIGVKPKTLNAWKNAGFLEGAYRQRRGEDRYWRDRLVECFFNGLEWDGD